MAATARISIALPPDLKNRMDAASASNVIRPNWSALFRARIEAELANLEQQRGDQTAAIARLRASRLENEQYDLVDGKAHGRAWAEQRADYRALKRLAKGVSQYKNAQDHPWEWLCHAVDPQGLVTDAELGAHLFNDGCSDRLEYKTYLGAFVEGAIETWKELAPYVESEEKPATKDYLPKLGSCVALAATEVRATTEQPADPPDSTRYSPP
jgi:hypothetical protein